jgi:ribosomal protein S18 acetylase RimI-like enzyme
MITVRLAIESDAPRIVAFQMDMAWESEALDLDLLTLEQGVAGVFKDTSRGTYWVAEDDGVLAGMLLTVPEWSDWRNATVLWVHSVYVTPQTRRQGVYRALYDHLHAMVEASPNLAGLRLYVDKGNTAAQHAYQALGMTSDHYHLYEWLKPSLPD